MDDAQLTKILVVEDESIVAKNIQNRLKRLGYKVTALASSGKEAIRKAEETHPDLVLMDIVLKGDMDGIEAARQIYTRFHIPVIYLTAYADEGTIQRAKVTEPFGYLLKPFEIRALHSAIQIALHKHKAEKKLKERKNWLAITLKSISNGVVVADTKGLITFMNSVAEALTGWKWKDALGKDLGKVFNIMNEETHNPLFSSDARRASGTTTESPVTKALREGVVVELANHTIIIAKNGRKTPIDVSAVPIRDDEGKVRGVVLVFWETAERKQVQAERLKAQKLESMDSDRIENIPIRVMVVSPFILVREGIRKVLEPEKDIEIIAEASTRLEIIPIIKQKNLDVLLIDTGIPSLDILKILESIREKSAETRVLLLLHGLDEEVIINTISLGVQGYLTDASDAGQFTRAIRVVNKGEMWIEKSIIMRVLTQPLTSRKGKPLLLKPNLTKREEEVVKLVVQGYSNKQISHKLFISEKTVKTHLNNTYKKLGISNRLQLTIDFL